jgi:hypothetical protein
MTRTDTPPADCPPSVELSAWHDGEGEDAVGAHLQGCPRCTRTVRSYGAIDTALRRQVRPGASLVQRIHAACQRDLESRTFILVWPVPVWRIASLAALVTLGLGALFLYAWNPAETHAPRPADEMAVRTVLPAANPLPMLAGANGSIPAPVAEFQPLRLGSAAGGPTLAGGGNLLSVSLPGVGLGGHSGASTGLMTLKEVAGDAVRHVWVVADTDQAVATLKHLLPEGTVLNPLSTRRSPRVAYRVLLSDLQVQELVDRMAEAGLSLVSPTLPQPGARERLLAQSKTVLYEMEFVPVPVLNP